MLACQNQIIKPLNFDIYGPTVQEVDDQLQDIRIHLGQNDGGVLGLSELLKDVLEKLARHCKDEFVRPCGESVARQRHVGQPGHGLQCFNHTEKIFRL